MIETIKNDLMYNSLESRRYPETKSNHMLTKESFDFDLVFSLPYCVDVDVIPIAARSNFLYKYISAYLKYATCVSCLRNVNFSDPALRLPESKSMGQMKWNE